VLFVDEGGRMRIKRAGYDGLVMWQAIVSIRYETEDRTEWCKVAGEARPCFLFARKFTRAAGFRLLDQVPSYETRLELASATQ
jgi:hypothetical protein